MSACWVFSHWEYLTIWKESSWRLLWEDTWLYLLLVLLWECYCRRLQLGFIIYGGFQGNSFLGAGCGQLLEVLLSLQSTWEVELSVLSIVKVILMYKRSFMSVDFRKRSCPLFSVWKTSCWNSAWMKRTRITLRQESLKRRIKHYFFLN